jgi:hypothetical protein
MSSTPIPPAVAMSEGETLQSTISNALQQRGAWSAYDMLSEMRRLRADDLQVRGLCEIIRSVIVRDFVSRPKGLQAVPKLTAEFLNNFDRFNLSAQEGYLVSLIDGRLDLQKLLVLSPFDQFTALFNLASLERQKAITVPS